MDIHANHAEAFFSALRRKCATFHRKTNMYAKSTTGLQRLLHVYWVVHNFLRVHFTIREGDCSESTGLPPEDVYRKVRVRTFEPGGQHDVRSR